MRTASDDEIEQSERFAEDLESYLEDYEVFLSKSLKPATVRKHGMVIMHAISYWCGEECITGLDQLTVAMVSSKFHRNFQMHTQEGLSRAALLAIVKKYLDFLYVKYGIRNAKLMEQLKNKKG